MAETAQDLPPITLAVMQTVCAGYAAIAGEVRSRMAARAEI